MHMNPHSFGISGDKSLQNDNAFEFNWNVYFLFI